MRQSGVPSSRIRLYADICSTPSAKAASRLSCQSRSVWPGRPDIRSTLRLRMPAARAIATASSVWAKVWMRPMALSNLSCAACIPSDRRFSPQAQAASSHRGDRVPGFPSAVISASGRTSKRRRSSSRTPRICAAGTSVGVPPPKKTVLTLTPGYFSAVRQISFLSAEQYAATVPSSAGAEQKSQ